MAKGKKGKQPAEQPLPGTAGSSQGQPAAGVGPSEPGPPQAAEGATGAENLGRQQTDPDLDDTTGAHP